MDDKFVKEDAAEVGGGEEAEAMIEAFNEWSQSFDKLCAERDQKGQAEYGTFTFLGNDVVRMMMEELADTANYCRMQFIKLMMLQTYLEQKLDDAGGAGITIGLGSFKGTGDVGWRKS